MSQDLAVALGLHSNGYGRFRGGGGIVHFRGGEEQGGSSFGSAAQWRTTAWPQAAATLQES
jgi:hypothetical protein